MAITRTPIIDDDGTGTTGTVIDNAWKTELYNQIDGVAGSAWTDIAYNAANFRSSGGPGTWTFPAAGLTTWRYTVGGSIAYFLLEISGSHTLSVSPAFLYIDVPGVPVAAKGSTAPLSYLLNNTVPGTGIVQCLPGTGRLDLLRDLGGTVWPAGTAQAHYFRASWFYSI